MSDAIFIIVFLIGVSVALALGVLITWIYFRTKFISWVNDHESAIREDARRKSRSTIIGQVTEQLIPFLPEFLAKYNPKDTRFLGSPIDLVIFDGLDEGNLKRVVFVEIKTGDSKLTEREIQVKNAIVEKRVDWEILSRQS
jgi:predicted Holliday junction resolvase-like endonuclease